MLVVVGGTLGEGSRCRPIGSGGGGTLSKQKTYREKERWFNDLALDRPAGRGGARGGGGQTEGAKQMLDVS